LKDGYGEDLPSIIPSYVYTLVASIVVGTLLIYAFDVSTVGTKNEAEQQQLRNLAEYVAVKCCELVSATKANNLSTSLKLDIPPLVGSQRYWIGLGNDSSVAWVESGYGTTPSSTEQRVPILSEVSASGVYVSDAGSPILECGANGTGTYLQLLGGL
jgi:hypothetical protein